MNTGFKREAVRIFEVFQLVETGVANHRWAVLNDIERDASQFNSNDLSLETIWFQIRFENSITNIAT